MDTFKAITQICSKKTMEAYTLIIIYSEKKGHKVGQNLLHSLYCPII